MNTAIVTQNHIDVMRNAVTVHPYLYSWERGYIVLLDQYRSLLTGEPETDGEASLQQALKSVAEITAEPLQVILDRIAAYAEKETVPGLTIH